MKAANIVLYDLKKVWDDLLPLTYTRPISHLKVGILNIAQKWEKLMNTRVSYSTRDYLSAKFPLQLNQENIVINSQLIPDQALIELIHSMKLGQAIYNKETFIAASINEEQLIELDKGRTLVELDLSLIQSDIFLVKLDKTHNLFSLNGSQIISDFELLTQNKSSKGLNETNTIIGEHPVFIEDGADVSCCIFNTSEGPIYVGHNATIMEGSIIRGPYAMGDHSVVKMGAKIYKDTSIGNYSKVGGELSNVNMFSYSNKGHDGYLGNAVIGEWCNLGADTNNSNLKNNYAEVKLWSYTRLGFEKTGLQFCGLIMGDHSKCGINTMFNTGTVVGVSANIYGGGYQKNFIPSFTWGEPKKSITYKLEKSLEVADIVMRRRKLLITGVDKKMLQDVFDLTRAFRK